MKNNKTKNAINFSDWFKNVKTIKKIPPVPKNFDTTHLQKFIDESKDSDD